MHREIGAYRTKNLGHNQKWLTPFQNSRLYIYKPFLIKLVLEYK